MKTAASPAPPDTAQSIHVACVGIDLGTTHSALAQGGTNEAGDGQVHAVDLPQLVGKSSVAARSQLPSFMYLAHESDGAQALPWAETRTYAVGEYARLRGAEVPNRVIASAKSWLGHHGVDRRGGILPADAPADVEKISPVEASFRYLEHIAEAYKAQTGRKLEDEQVVLTVPASFDAAARELTVEAATAAGFEHLTLLEEPQAALYAWIHAQGNAWRKALKVGDVVLIVDVGGGTTDLTAVAVEDEGGNLSLRRIAVGDHILLGGDNMDLLLAHVAKEKLLAEGKELDGLQEASLVYACRAAKERLLGDPDDKIDSVPITLAARGSKLLGSTLRTELSRAEVTEVVLEGFFPNVQVSDAPMQRTRSGLRTVGLPYAQDAAITKHLSQFLTRQAGAQAANASADNASKAGFLVPTHVLMNGGVLKSPALRNRVMACLTDWCKAAKMPAPVELPGADYDLSVAKGAAAYGLARAGKGVRIRGGAALSYFVGVESNAPSIPGVPPAIDLLCVAPHGMEEGTSAKVPELTFSLVVGEPVTFRFFASSTRRSDAVGSTLPLRKAPEVSELAPIAATLPPKGRTPGEEVVVSLQTELTEVGTLKLLAVPTEGEPWEIELSIRS
jgi:Hsp70 protein